MRFAKMTVEERNRAETLLAKFLARDEYKGLRHNTWKFYALVGAAARGARHGNPPNRNQRLGYRTAKRNRARKLLIAMYGDPGAEHPVPGMTKEGEKRLHRYVE